MENLPPQLPQMQPPADPGLALLAQGRFDEALTHFSKMLELEQQTKPPNSPELTIPMHMLGVVYEKKRDLDKALDYFQKALEIRRQSLPPQHPLIGVSLHSLGSIYGNRGDLEQSLNYFQQALDARKLSLPPDHRSPRL